MGIKIQVTPDDLLETRFAYNPLVELTISYCMLQNPAAHGRYQRWVDQTLRALHNVELPLMSELIVPGCHYVPDFLTPTPTVIQLRIDSQQLSAPFPNQGEVEPAPLVGIVHHHGMQSAALNRLEGNAVITQEGG